MFRRLTPLRILVTSASLVLIVTILLVAHLPTSKPSIISDSAMTTSTLTVSKPSLSVAFFLNLSSGYYQENLKMFEKNLKNGDYMILRGNPTDPLAVIREARQTKSSFTDGVNVNSCLFYYKIRDIVEQVPTLPSGIDFVVYDYEKGDHYSPEFTTDQSKSTGYFDQAQNAVMQYNKNTGGNAQLMITPPFGELRHANWDWGLVVNHMDTMDMQLQAFANDHTLMKSYISSTLDNMSKSKKHLVFVQLSLSRNTVLENIGAINAVKDSRIHAFLIWYKANQTAELEDFFNILKR